MQTRKVKFLIVGAGTAGLGARRAVAAQTDDYLVADPGPLGTTCARVGCMPSKLLIAAAERAHTLGEESLFGVRSGGREVDGPAVLQRVRSERDRFVSFVTRDMGSWEARHLLPHPATFVAPNVMKVGDERIEAERIVLAVGSRPTVPKPLQGFDKYMETSDTLFELPDLPRSVAVIGMGVIGLELGQALHRLGVKVRIFGREGRIGGIKDLDVRMECFKVLKAELDLHPYAEIRLAEAEGGVRVSWKAPMEDEGEEVFEKVLMAAGRRSNVDRLHLEKSGLPLDENGTPVWDRRTLQVGSAPVFLAGDDTQELMILHEAADEGRIAGLNAVHFPDLTAHRRRTQLQVIFTDPNILHVGLWHDALDPEVHAVGEVSFWDQGRSRVMGANKGMLRIYGERDGGRLVGAEGIGPRLEHIGHLLAWAVQANLTVDGALDMPFYHPVVEEGVRTALRDLKKHVTRPLARAPFAGAGA